MNKWTDKKHQPHKEVLETFIKNLMIGLNLRESVSFSINEVKRWTVKAWRFLLRES